MTRAPLVAAVRRARSLPAAALALALGAAGVMAAAAALGAQSVYPARCGVGFPSAEQRGYVPLPRGDVFCPLIADPKATQSFVSYLRERSGGSSPDTSINIASVGIGDSFGIGRWGGSGAGDGVQLSIAGGVFAQFDLGTDSYDLLNADYVIGLPLTLRRGPLSGRLRFYHQSSHLGDEFLLREGQPPERENLSFESLEAILSLDASALRLYGGGEYLINRNPDDLEHYVAHAGAEVRPLIRIIPLGALGGFRVLAGVDLKASQERDWDPSISVRGGLEYDRAGPSEANARRWSLFFEYYTGPSPYGQFFRADVRHIGAGVHFGI